MLERNVIEVAPLAFMRGRTLNDAFIIMDEAQNTTSEQMKMFLTRLGNNAKAVITGDVTQIDLPNAKKSGLIEAMNILKRRRRNQVRRVRVRRRGAPSPGAADHRGLRQLRQGAARTAAQPDRARGTSAKANRPSRSNRSKIECDTIITGGPKPSCALFERPHAWRHSDAERRIPAVRRTLRPPAQFPALRSQDDPYRTSTIPDRRPARPAESTRVGAVCRAREALVAAGANGTVSFC